MISKWNSIKTVPIDTAILVYANGFYIVHFNSIYNKWIGYGFNTADTINLNSINPPTYWMSLPDKPIKDVI